MSWTLEGFGLGDRATYRRARAEVREAALRQRGLEEAIAGQVVRLQDEVRSLRSRIDAARARVEAAREAADLVAARFQAGDAIQLEVLEASREDAESRAELIQAVIGYNQAQHLLHYHVSGAPAE